MAFTGKDAKQLFDELLSTEDEEQVTAILKGRGLLDRSHWRLLGGDDFGNNRSMVNNQQSEPGGAFVEKVINSVDSLLMVRCLLAGIDPESPDAPRTMAEAAERFFKIPDGNLANVDPKELAENIQVVATGSKTNPCYVVVDRGEGQTPNRFEDTFLSLKRQNKSRIPFVQGKYNCGGTGVLPFCGTRGYQLIVSRRHPKIAADPSKPNEKDSSSDLWGFTVVCKRPPSESGFNTTAWVYLAPDGEVPRFKADTIKILPDVAPDTVGEDSDEDEVGEERPPKKSSRPVPVAYAKDLEWGTGIKLYNFQWTRRGLATLEVRLELERYLQTLSLPARVIETRGPYKANYFATTVTGTAVTIANDKAKGFLEGTWGGEINIRTVGRLPITIALYKEKKDKKDKTAKSPRRIPRGLRFTINGQVHGQFGPEFFTTRGLKYDYINDTLAVTVECSGLDMDIRDQLVMPSRDRFRDVPQLQEMLDAVVADLKDREPLRRINDERRKRAVAETLSDDSARNVLQQLVNSDPVFATLFKNGKGLRNPFVAVPEPTSPFEGRYPPTYFHYKPGKHHIAKRVPIDRTCRIVLETDAKNDYFQMPSPSDRGNLSIEPPCFDRWSLTDGRLAVILRAPSDAHVGDELKVTVTVSDPVREAGGSQPWVNTVGLTFEEGGKPTKPGGEPAPKRGGDELGFPNVVEVFRDRWEDAKYGFDERSGLKVMKNPNGSYDFHVNMDNKFLHNELLHQKEDGQNQVKFAYKWGMALIALGLLQDAEANGGRPAESDGVTIEARVSQLSKGVAAVIVPTVLHLMKVMGRLPQAAGVLN